LFCIVFFSQLAAMSGALQYSPGDKIEVFSRTPYGLDNGHERLDLLGERWILSPTVSCGKTRPRIGWTERWLPGTVVPGPPGVRQAQVSFRWDVRLWFDWASGEHIDTSDPASLLDVASASRIRPRTTHWSLRDTPASATSGSELGIGGVPVSVSFIVFRWGAAKIPVQYDTHSWGRVEGSTVSGRCLQLFFNRSVVPRLGWDYEVLTVFVQHSDEFAGISAEFLTSICRGRHIVALYFLWPVQSQQTYGDKVTSTAAYVEQGPCFDLVARMEAAGVPTRWPHHSQLWRCLACKEWVLATSIVPKYHVPLSARVSRSYIVQDPVKAASQALATLWKMQAVRREDDSYSGPTFSDWEPGSAERCVAKLGYSYEGVDVKMCTGEAQLAEALYTMSTQPGYFNDCVHVQQRVHAVDLEARCFVVHGRVTDVLYTRFARIDSAGYVRDYEKAHSANEAMQMWFENDQEAWHHAHEQIAALTRRWHAWLLCQSSEVTISTRIDYMLARVMPGRAEVWTGEIGEQGYSMGGIDPAIVFNAVVDSISSDLKRHPVQSQATLYGKRQHREGLVN